MSHLVLLGDSVFDNAAYTKGGPDVLTQVRALLPKQWKASLLAIDGSTTNDVRTQLGRLLKDATHIVLSVGGNDALMQLEVLDKPVSVVAEALGEPWLRSSPISRSTTVWQSLHAWPLARLWLSARFITDVSMICRSNPWHQRH